MLVFDWTSSRLGFHLLHNIYPRFLHYWLRALSQNTHALICVCVYVCAHQFLFFMFSSLLAISVRYTYIRYRTLHMPFVDFYGRNFINSHWTQKHTEYRILYKSLLPPPSPHTRRTHKYLFLYNYTQPQSGSIKNTLTNTLALHSTRMQTHTHAHFYINSITYVYKIVLLLKQRILGVRKSISQIM